MWQGQTPGKRAIGLRVISVTGRPVTIYETLLRNLLRTVDQLPAFYAIGILSLLLTARNQRLGDLAAATVVVHERPADERAESYAPPSGRLRYGAGRLEGNEIVLIESFLRRRDELDEETRGRTGAEIARRIRQRLGISEAPAGDEQFLEHVASEYRESGRY
jgi:hypothetical protein